MNYRDLFWKVIFWTVFTLIFWGLSYLVYNSGITHMWAWLIPFYYAYAWGKGVGVIIFVVALALFMEILGQRKS